MRIPDGFLHDRFDPDIISIPSEILDETYTGSAYQCYGVGEDESIRYHSNIHPGFIWFPQIYQTEQMHTGIGIIASVSNIDWIAINPSYPSEPKYAGELTTSAGETYGFVSDTELIHESSSIRILGRLINFADQTVIKISEAHAYV